jgi:peptide/nickel transport system ATP-binding protein
MLLEVRNLKTYFHLEDGLIKAVDGVSFCVEPEKTLGIVGESGCGKSVTGLSIMGLVPMPAGRIEGGEILFNRKGEILDLVKLDPHGSQMRSIRGNEIAMVFQEPMTSLNPVYTVGNQIVEAICLHQKVKKREARKIAVGMLREVGIPLPERRIDAYPHELSGGMRQRVMIAMALSCHPSLIIADEPTTALDVTIQAQVLDLVVSLRNRLKTSIILITHDLGVIAGITDEVIVMYLGKVVEHASTRALFRDPRHPYTQGLLRSIPSLIAKTRLTPIQGVVPDLLDPPSGCGFEPRCAESKEICKKEIPPLEEVSPRHDAACWLYHP